MHLRRILDNNYIRSLHSPKMRLVKDPIEDIRPGTMTTPCNEFDIDFIILATGFEFSQWQAKSVIGRQGTSLQQHWDAQGGIGAYKTIAVNEFPNMFYLLGPNSGSGHTSVLFAIECSIDLVIKVARPVLKNQATAVEVCKEAETGWCDTIQSALSKTVLGRTCSNHETQQYIDPKTGWNFFSYPFSSLKFWADTRLTDKDSWRYT
ncbi:hypothetical protein VI817_007920 [Penicillium citrinum]|nr:hypothetical protein VI817_007920 [Penicillium citrinum]